MKSKLLFESFSNGSKSVNLVSHSLLAYDTRYTGSSSAAEGKHNVFDCILQPSRAGTNRASLQLELHYRCLFSHKRQPLRTVIAISSIFSDVSIVAIYCIHIYSTVQKF